MYVRKIVSILLCLGLVLSSGLVLAEEGEPQQVEQRDKYEVKELTKRQQKKVAPYVEKAFESKREMIKKYIEVGALDKEKGEKWLKKIDEKEQKMKEQGYSLSCPRYKRMDKEQ